MSDWVNECWDQQSAEETRKLKERERALELLRILLRRMYDDLTTFRDLNAKPLPFEVYLETDPLPRIVIDEATKPRSKSPTVAVVQMQSAPPKQEGSYEVFVCDPCADPDAESERILKPILVPELVEKRERNAWD